MRSSQKYSAGESIITGKYPQVSSARVSSFRMAEMKILKNSNRFQKMKVIGSYGSDGFIWVPPFFPLAGSLQSTLAFLGANFHFFDLTDFRRHRIFSRVGAFSSSKQLMLHEFTVFPAFMTQSTSITLVSKRYFLITFPQLVSEFP